VLSAPEVGPPAPTVTVLLVGETVKLPVLYPPAPPPPEMLDPAEPPPAITKYSTSKLPPKSEVLNAEVPVSVKV
jgi:hypothetical protein